MFRSLSRWQYAAGVALLVVGFGAGVLYTSSVRRTPRTSCPPTCTATATRVAAPVTRSLTTAAPVTAGNSDTSSPPRTQTSTLAPSSEIEDPAYRIPVLEYHDTGFSISDGQVMMTAEWFLEQMQWLADSHFTTLSADEFLDFLYGTGDYPERSVLLTFDIGTGRADDYRDIIMPALRERGFKAALFVLTNAISEDGSNNTVSWDMLRQWRDEGLISVQSHGVYHPDYTQLSFGQMLWDAKTSLDLIAREMGQAPLIFAFPLDSLPDDPALVMGRAGYRAAMGGERPERSVLRGDPDRFALPRYYPYSNEADYPILVGRERWTFGEMLVAAIGGAEGQATATREAPPPAASPSALVPPTSLEPLISYCQRTGNRDGLDIDTAAAYRTDLSEYAQSLLAHPLLVRPTCRHGGMITPEAIVVHYTGGTYQASLENLRGESGQSSIHYIVDRDGTITQMVPEVFGAYHVTCYGVRNACLPDCPVCQDDEGRLTEPWTRTIGIEIVNMGPLRGEPGEFHYRDGTPFDGLVFVDYLASWRYRYWEDYPEEQVAALRILVEDIMQRWGIPLNMIMGHSRIQPEKIDPGPALNLTWNRYGDPPRPPIFSPISGDGFPGYDPTTVPEGLSGAD